MDKGTLVCFALSKKSIPSTSYRMGTGEVISGPDDKGRVLVACDPYSPDLLHPVILCALADLTERKT